MNTVSTILEGIALAELSLSDAKTISDMLVRGHSFPLDTLIAARARLDRTAKNGGVRNSPKALHRLTIRLERLSAAINSAPMLAFADETARQATAEANKRRYAATTSKTEPAQ